MKPCFLVLLILFFTSSLLPAQEVTDVSTRIDGEYVTIFYTLTDNEQMAGRLYVVELYAIINQTDTVKLTKVEGDVGEVQAGENYIQWNVKEEFERFRGSLSFEVRATPVFVITRPAEGSKFNRGGSYFLKWYGGGSHNDSLVLELYRNDEFVAVIDTVADEDKVLWHISPKLKVGKGYRIRIVGTDKTHIDEFSSEFVIRRKIPFWAQLLPFVAASGVGVYYLIRNPGPKPTRIPLPDDFPVPGHN
ncbi:MAG: hypothetical protein D6730_11235 [Bacteroidetes bacterium]|nr:MAG: hypothetical protein D6730_11235 [Bacteroidota bacterium]